MARFVHVDLPFIFFTQVSHFDPKCCAVNRVLTSFDDDPLVTYWKCQIGFLDDEQAVPRPLVLQFYFRSRCPDHTNGSKSPSAVRKKYFHACAVCVKFVRLLFVWLNPNHQIQFLGQWLASNYDSTPIEHQFCTVKGATCNMLRLIPKSDTDVLGW